MKAAVEFIYRVVTGRKTTRVLLTPVGGLFFFSVIVGLVYASLEAESRLGLPGLVPSPWNIISSVPFLGAGGFLVLWSVFHFYKAKGTPVPFNPPERLVTGGPYAYARNPMLTGAFMVLFGTGFLLKSILVAFVMTPLVVLLSVLELKAVEEPELLKRFGQDYERYRKDVPMFFFRPGVIKGQRNLRRPGD